MKENLDHLSKKLTTKNNAFDAARAGLVAEVERTFPLGTVIETLLGRAWVRGPVTGYGGTFRPREIQFLNEKTGKERTTYIGDGNLSIIHVPKGKAA